MRHAKQPNTQVHVGEGYVTVSGFDFDQTLALLEFLVKGNRGDQAIHLEEVHEGTLLGLDVMGEVEQEVRRVREIAEQLRANAQGEPTLANPPSRFPFPWVAKSRAVAEEVCPWCRAPSNGGCACDSGSGHADDWRSPSGDCECDDCRAFKAKRNW